MYTIGFEQMREDFIDEAQKTERKILKGHRKKDRRSIQEKYVLHMEYSH